MGLRQGKKTIQIVAGPNGSGKSTFAEGYLLQHKKESPIFVNSDVIATGISPLNVDAAAFAAGRVMLNAIHDLLKKGENFSFESTLSGKTWVTLLKQAKAQGYEIQIYFLFLDNVKDNLKRIRERVSRGGHHVPEDAVRRRYPKSLENFWTIYRPLCDEWFIFNNSGKKPKLIQSLQSYNELTSVVQSEFAISFLAKASGCKK